MLYNCIKGERFFLIAEWVLKWAIRLSHPLELNPPTQRYPPSKSMLSIEVYENSKDEEDSYVYFAISVNCANALP
jgi:hypothetical protein